MVELAVEVEVDVEVSGLAWVKGLEVGEVHKDVVLGAGILRFGRLPAELGRRRSGARRREPRTKHWRRSGRERWC